MTRPAAPTPPKNKGKRLIKINAISYAHLVHYMLDGTYTCKELAELTGLHYVTVLQYTREMHRAGACHISGWDKDEFGRDLLKIYKIGAGRDKPRERKSRNDIARAYRAKKKARETLHMFAGETA